MSETNGSVNLKEEQSRTLYIRLPHTIKDEQEIIDLVNGDVKIKLPRQLSRHCHVIFPSVEEKIKNLKTIKKMLINGKRVIASIPRPRSEPPRLKIGKAKDKMVKISKPKKDPTITKVLFVSNIKPGTKTLELKEAFPGCVSVAMLKGTDNKPRKAIVKMESIQMAAEYLKQERPMPTVKGNLITIQPDNRKRKRGRKGLSQLKIYDGNESQTTEDSKSNDESSAKENDSEESDVSESHSDPNKNEE